MKLFFKERFLLLFFSLASSLKKDMEVQETHFSLFRTGRAKQFHGCALTRVCMSKGPRALCLTAIGADIVWCLHVYAASSWVPM